MIVFTINQHGRIILHRDPSESLMDTVQGILVDDMGWTEITVPNPLRGIDQCSVFVSPGDNAERALDRLIGWIGGRLPGHLYMVVEFEYEGVNPIACFLNQRRAAAYCRPNQNEGVRKIPVNPKDRQ